MDKQKPRGMAIAAGKSGSEKIPTEELSNEKTRFAAATRQRTNRGNVPHADDNRIGPCRVQQQRGTISISSREEDPEPWTYL